ncbi:hypothetical protein AOXY_G11390 [Acipenser oxyrinchus oxyrinchus]|uniref:Resistance to inhibitors of cholinesterase protein 3 N-terminal domain-containing protein n=1 Tax=Acipenser oxyrinchus oxyrinchus TaxID=40147 RepID=A0AAD8G720_ACIOX|nr:hypothetical protein AOXY_G11390 [Acipenser oxyrinchus oxyrinchus]
MGVTSSQQVLIAFSLVMFAFVIFPRMSGGGTKDARAFDAHQPRKVEQGPGRGHHSSMNADSSKSQSFESMQQMRKVMEQEMKNEKYKGNNKGFVFTLMPLYAIGVAVFAVYKFLKIKSQDETGAVKRETSKGNRKPEDTENQLHELEQRLSQTEKMLNSILTQLDPLTNCVESVASEQKNEIMAQLQSIRQLMRKRGMNRPQLNTEEPTCDKKLEDLIQSLKEHETECNAKEGEEISDSEENLLEDPNADEVLSDICENEDDESKEDDLGIVSSETQNEDVEATQSVSEELKERDSGVTSMNDQWGILLLEILF